MDNERQLTCSGEEHQESISPLPLSSLQHFAYCRRQFALIHLDRQWADNRFTVEGQLLHQRVNEGGSEQRADVLVSRAVWLVSSELGVTGVADVVEFHRVTDGGCALIGHPGQWRPFPVEYKRGRSKSEDWDRIQLCAQAMALEEMLNTGVHEGALFYGRTRRREGVVFSQELRGATQALAAGAHDLYRSERLPAPEPGPKCDRCSLRQVCMPNRGRVDTYLHRVLDS